MTQKAVVNSPKKRRKISGYEIPLHLMLIPGIIIIFIFHYVPLGGLIIAFQRFIPAKGLFGNQKWVGLQNFQYIFSMPNTMNVLRNTVTIAVAKIVLGLVIPITVALMLNELQLTKVKRSIQTIIYFPHFLSWIIFGSIIMDLLSPQNGIINKLLNLLGHESIYFLGDNKYFQQTIIWTDVWKNFGYGTVVYMASITSIDPSLYEAAAIGGANRWKQTWHITLPGMRMIIVLMMVLSLGNVLNAGFDQVYNMYSPIVYETGDIIDTMVYRLGLENAKYGPAAAVSIFKSVVSMLFISVSYYVADRFFDYRYGPLEYRTLRFETEVLDMANFQGNAVVNYTSSEVPFTRIIEHKHFEFGRQEKTVISREYPSAWKSGDEPYYPVNDEKNETLYAKYADLARKEASVIFGGRLGTYKYYDMHHVIGRALETVRQEEEEQRK